jgi:histidinol phosphatase-like enzyme
MTGCLFETVRAKTSTRDAVVKSALPITKPKIRGVLLAVCLDAAYYCPHAPEQKCGCRKPSPEIFLRAAKELDLDPSFMVGDMASDIGVGERGMSNDSLVGAGKPNCSSRLKQFAQATA